MKNILILLVLLGLQLPSAAVAEEVLQNRHLNIDKAGTPLQGYDPVSYFTGTPLPGKAELIFVYDDVTYRFASQENLTQFAAGPEKYLPAYGGWCAWAMLDGEKVEINPKRFRIIEGVNYLFYDGFWGNTLKKWQKLALDKGEANLVHQAAENWNKIVSQ